MSEFNAYQWLAGLLTTIVVAGAPLFIKFLVDSMKENVLNDPSVLVIWCHSAISFDEIRNELKDHKCGRCIYYASTKPTRVKSNSIFFIKSSFSFKGALKMTHRSKDRGYQILLRDLREVIDEHSKICNGDCCMLKTSKQPTKS